MSLPDDPARDDRADTPAPAPLPAGWVDDAYAVAGPEERSTRSTDLDGEAEDFDVGSDLEGLIARLIHRATAEARSKRLLAPADPPERMATPPGPAL